ncbi:MAG TPA: hypothetical protein DDZ41_03615, partial [Flavobacterium sp.]|nr:hypothetical protein [Flavobacterium sp.]
MQLTSIGVLTCWYGAYPWYFPYYVHSCSFNTSIDFFIITDNHDEIPNKPDNLIIINKTLEDIKKIATEKLGFQVSLEYSFKLNDFKPAYAFLFPEIFKGYDYWGQCDLDLIYGDIRFFLNEDFLNNYDYLSMRHDYTTGCFSLYRNSDKMNTFFMKSKDYRSVLSSFRSCCFDECGSKGYIHLKSGKSIFELESDIVSFTHIIKAAEITNEIKAHFDFILLEGNPGKIIFDNGKIIYDDKIEAIMYHLVYF